MSVAANNFCFTGSGGALRWREETDSAIWDRELARLGGHPLQSALWGDARREADGIEDRRFLAEGQSGTLLMARMELRRVPLIGGQVGWVPRGPAGGTSEIDPAAFRALAVNSHEHPMLVVTDRWNEIVSSLSSAATRRPETIWVDLSSGRDQVWQRLDRQWRYGVGKAKRVGVTVAESRSQDDMQQFIELTHRIGTEKKFDSAISSGTLRRLLGCNPEGPVSAHMFVARCGSEFAAAALIFKCGRSIHYLSGGTDRRYSRQRVGEVLHWSIIEWAIGEGINLYDLEGIDRARNAGTFAFKKKMGGREVTLAGKRYLAASGFGLVVGALDRCREHFRSM